MLIFTESKLLKAHIKSLKKKGLSVGFVPTMGALHAGHISLIKASRSKTKATVCSIFVNPTQFNDKKDFEKYPSTVDNDLRLLKQVGCDIVFLPSVQEMYPSGYANKGKIDFGFLAETLEGEHRPGHFDGMAQIVEKLLLIVNPGWLFMGAKDYQQQLIVKHLIKSRKLKVRLVAMATKREKDGLAMSSRNVRLDRSSRKTAVMLSQTLNEIGKSVRKLKSIRGLETIRQDAVKQLNEEGKFEVEYLEIRNANTLKKPRSIREKLVALVAARIGGVRLIDNMQVN